MTASEIAGMVQDGWVCFSDIGLAIPPEITNALAARAAAGSLKRVIWHSLLDLEPLDILSPEAAHIAGAADFLNGATETTQATGMADTADFGIRPVSWFSGKAFARAVNEHRADIMPCNYHDMPEHARNLERIDALLIRTSTIDDNGYFYTGLCGSMMEVLLERAEHIYIEANTHIPHLPGSVRIHIDQVDAYCVSDREPPDIHAAAEDETSKIIAEYIADEIPDGATIQLGIGSVPEAVGRLLKEKRDLGIHTELFSDSCRELIECGAVTNSRKELYTGKSVTTVAFGSKELGRFLDGNPDVLMLPVNITNDPYVIAQHKNFMSINAALEVDLFGQVCAESIGNRHVSGSGGQSDFVRGAVMSEGGKSFIAFPSTAAGGRLSRIKLTLSEGAIVTTSKNDVDMIVTEYGIARLRGKTLSQRARALIAIAHPNFRDELTSEARKSGLL